MAGTLSITNPATDSASGYSTTTLPVTWSFTGTGTAVQVQRRVKMVPVGSTATILDTGMQSSTETTHTVGNLASGVSYTVTVTVVDSNGGTTSASRVIVSSYARPLPATLTFSDVGYGLRVQVVNVSDGARPNATTNAVYRRLTGSSDDWTLAGAVGNNATLDDRRVRANVSYDYFARTNGAVDSDVFTVTAGPIFGVWAHVPGANYPTAINFLYATAATEATAIESSVLQFVGRTYPVLEQGVAHTDTLAVSVRLPPDVRVAGEQWWRDRMANADVFFYRDGRGRSWPVAIISPVTTAPDGPGSIVTTTVQRVDFQETMLPAGSYGVNGSADGGYGTGGYGTNGYGL